MNTSPDAKVRHVKSDILWFSFTSGGNAFIFRTSAGLVLLDSGFYRLRRSLLSGMKREGIDPNQIVLGFISHCHNDHAAAMGWLAQNFNFPVVAHLKAARAVETGDPIKTGSDIPYSGHCEPFIPCPVKYKVSGGETFLVGEHAFTVIPAPGHTPGSIHIESSSTLMVGDTIFGNGGIGWMDIHWGSNPGDYVKTLRLMRQHVGATILPGHGPPFRLTRPRINRAIKIAAFYIPRGHGLGSPRPVSEYTTHQNQRTRRPKTIRIA